METAKIAAYLDQLLAECQSVRAAYGATYKMHVRLMTQEDETNAAAGQPVGCYGDWYVFMRRNGDLMQELLAQGDLKVWNPSAPLNRYVVVVKGSHLYVVDHPETAKDWQVLAQGYKESSDSEA